MTKHPCPCCGFLVFAEPTGSYDICPVCEWEDDGVQAEIPGYAGGANRDSLYQYQLRVALRRAPLGVEMAQGYRRAHDWRPLVATEAITKPSEPRIEYHDSAIYYWRRPQRG